jgi:hypothetical protein
MRENIPGSHEITIMIMGSIGRIRSFTISRRILLWSSIFLFFYILISLFIIGRFIDTRSRYRAKSYRLKEITEKYDVTSKELLKARQYAANLEAYINTTSDQKETGGTIQGEGQAAAGRDRSVSSASTKGSEQTAKSVEIEGLNIRKLNSGVVVDFRLVNMNSGVGAVEGYMHVIVSDKNNNFPSAWNAPSKEVRNGLPSDFRSGEHFIIQRFKQYHREFTSGSSGMPVSISILAYDPSGALLLKREYEVNNVS